MEAVRPTAVGETSRKECLRTNLGLPSSTASPVESNKVQVRSRAEDAVNGQQVDVPLGQREQINRLAFVNQGSDCGVASDSGDKRRKDHGQGDLQIFMDSSSGAIASFSDIARCSDHGPGTISRARQGRMTA